MAKVSEYKSYGFGVVLLCLFCSGLCAQQRFLLRINPVDKTEAFLQSLRLNTSFNNRNECQAYIKRLPQQLSSQGYVAASVDSIKADSSALTIDLYIGDKYLWNGLRFTDADAAILGNIGYHTPDFSHQPFDAGKVAKLYDDLLDYFSNNGYPFASIGLDSMQLENGLVNAKLKIDKGAIYRLDSISVTGNAKISSSYLHHYLGIEKGSYYNQQQLDKINKRLMELSFLQQTQPWNLTMLNTGAVLNLYLEPKRSNEINVLVGFLPANQQLGGKLLLTGEATLNLKNAFGGAETFALDWQQIQPKSPRLNILFQRPYLFGSRFGLDFNFELFKKDSSFLNVNASAGLNYYLSEKQSGRIFIQTASTNVLDVDTNLVKITRQLPQVNDVGALNLGIEYNFINTDYRYNPRSGNELNILAFAGTKTVKRNNAIMQLKQDDFNYASLYDTVQLNAYQVKLRVAAAHYFKTGKLSTIKTALQSGWYHSPNYFLNDLFQIGGYKLLRGFDEESIYTNLFAVATIEYRLILAQNSYFFGFTDIGSANFKTNAASYSHSYIGAGIGLAFEANGGIFDISYAVGKRDDSNLDFRQSKIHLGFVSRF